jgi:hypothetical protein
VAVLQSTAWQNKGGKKGAKDPRDGEFGLGAWHCLHAAGQRAGGAGGRLSIRTTHLRNLVRAVRLRAGATRWRRWRRGRR